MKRSRHQETDLHQPAEKTLEIPAPENPLVFLVFAIFILAVCAFENNRPIPRQLQVQQAGLHARYVWLTGSSETPEGLYQLHPGQFEEHFPAPELLGTSWSFSETDPPVSAIDIESGKPRGVSLPPIIADLFFQPIDINRAEEEVLVSLPGIGPVLAKNIVQTRKLHGPFRSKQDLLQVTGIGPKKLAALIDHIIID